MNLTFLRQVLECASSTFAAHQSATAARGRLVHSLVLHMAGECGEGLI